VKDNESREIMKMAWLIYSPYIMSNQNLKAKHQWVGINDDQGILISNYTVLGEQHP